MKRFRGGLAFQAHRRLYHSTLGLRVIKKRMKKKKSGFDGGTGPPLRALRSAVQLKNGSEIPAHIFIINTRPDETKQRFVPGNLKRVHGCFE